MPGMNSGIDITDPLGLAAFRSALLHQLVIAVLIFAVLGATWLTGRTAAMARTPQPGAFSACVGAFTSFDEAHGFAVNSRQVALVAIVASPARVAGLQAFDRRERLDQVPDWLYLTGSPARLRRVWAAYGLAAPVLPGAPVTGNGDAAWLIDPHGQVREELSIFPGPGTAASESSFAALLAGTVRRFMQP